MSSDPLAFWVSMSQSDAVLAASEGGHEPNLCDRLATACWKHCEGVGLGNATVDGWSDMVLPPGMPWKLNGGCGTGCDDHGTGSGPGWGAHIVGGSRW